MALALAWTVVTDLRQMIIPDWITLPGILISALLSPVMWTSWQGHLASGVLAGVIFWGLATIKVRGQYAMGLGDVKLYAWLGFVFAQAVLPIMLLASIIGLLVAGLVGLIGKSSIRDKRFPHGPHIVLASYLVAIVCIGVS